jgi:hypothetical protein
MRAPAFAAALALLAAACAQPRRGAPASPPADGSPAAQSPATPTPPQSATAATSPSAQASTPGATSPAPGAASPSPSAAHKSPAEADTSRIARLEREVRALAVAAGCRAQESCRVAPIGARACGGPRTYVPYCATATDTAALMAKLDELKRADEEYNARNRIASTCEFREPPVVVLRGGACRTAGDGGIQGRAVVP